jgi:hypothetical protein
LYNKSKAVPYISTAKAGSFTEHLVNENKSMMKKTITSLERIDEPTDPYNMTVDNSSTYFADGFAVHNKDRHPSSLRIQMSGNYIQGGGQTAMEKV